MATQIVSANTNPTTVIIKEGGAKGDTGDAGANGTGLNDIRYGLLANPICHLLKTNNIAAVSAPLNTDADVSVARASTATYRDFYGTVQTAAINELRQEAAGWLIEGASTNTLLYSEQFDNAAWTGSNITVTPNTGIAPDGTTTADTVSIPAAGGFFVQGITPASATFYTCSIWVRALSGSGVGDLTLQVDGSVSDNGQISVGGLINTETFTRITTSVSTTVGATDLRIAFVTANPFITSFEVWGAQLEANVITSYISTTTASVTRAADLVNVPSYNNMANQTEFTITSGILTPDTPEDYFKVFLFMPTLSGQKISIYSDGGVFKAFNGVAVLSSGVQTRVVKNYALTVLNGITNLYVNGVLRVQANSVPTQVDTAQNIEIGREGAGISFANHKDLRFYNFALNQSEISYLSGV